MVFAIALTPFSAFHHHEEEPVCAAAGKICAHTVHIHSHSDNCLVCAAHFEKSYTTTQNHFETYFLSRTLLKTFGICSGSYVALIGTALRGPPTV